MRGLIGQMHQEGKIPLLVGGSGLYLDSVIYDYKLEGHGRSKELEEELAALDNEAVHAILMDMNPEAAEKIHPNNRKEFCGQLNLPLNNKPTRQARTFLIRCLVPLFNR